MHQRQFIIINLYNSTSKKMKIKGKQLPFILHSCSSNSPSKFYSIVLSNKV